MILGESFFPVKHVISLILLVMLRGLFGVLNFKGVMSLLKLEVLISCFLDRESIMRLFDVYLCSSWVVVVSKVWFWGSLDFFERQTFSSDGLKGILVSFSIFLLVVIENMFIGKVFWIVDSYFLMSKNKKTKT